VETVIHSDSDFATVAFLRIKGARLEAKAGTATAVVCIPPLLDDEYSTVYETILQSQQMDLNSPQAQIESKSFRHPKVPLIRSRQVGAWVSISNIQSPSEGSMLKDEVTRCFELLIGVCSPCWNACTIDFSSQNVFLSITCDSRTAQLSMYSFHLLTYFTM